MEMATRFRPTTQLEVHFAVMHMLREDLPRRVFKCQMWVSLLALTWGGGAGWSAVEGNSAVK